jgi:hypothetical protein
VRWPWVLLHVEEILFVEGEAWRNGQFGRELKVDSRRSKAKKEELGFTTEDTETTSEKKKGREKVGLRKAEGSRAPAGLRLLYFLLYLCGLCVLCGESSSSLC